MPTLIADGTDDQLDPIANDHILASLITGSRLMLYPDAGHGFLRTPRSCSRTSMTGARQTHFRYDQNLNSVPRPMPTSSATFPATRPVSPSVCVVNPRQDS